MSFEIKASTWNLRADHMATVACIKPRCYRVRIGWSRRCGMQHNALLRTKAEADRLAGRVNQARRIATAMWTSVQDPPHGWALGEC